MNCQPGDRAMVVRHLPDYFATHKPPMGAIAMVVMPLFAHTLTRSGLLVPMAFWLHVEPIRCLCCNAVCTRLPDEILRPLPPSGDVRDFDLDEEFKLALERIAGPKPQREFAR